ncbi:MAG: hypothetical protein KatS3mg126_0888 [Lysobacteraceae bacterium]|nr:MAG: hypothetical protein KatS3mg126_0888 [Xanthomonadaceae bacterium]
MVAARRAYRALFHGRVEPRQVAELLILRPEFPRSLRFCYQRITDHLDQIEGSDPVRAAAPRRIAHLMDVQLRYARIDEIMRQGLHEYLTDVVERTAELGERIASAYLF